MASIVYVSNSQTMIPEFLFKFSKLECGQFSWLSSGCVPIMCQPSRNNYSEINRFPQVGKILSRCNEIECMGEEKIDRPCSMPDFKKKSSYCFSLQTLLPGASLIEKNDHIESWSKMNLIFLEIHKDMCQTLFHNSIRKKKIEPDEELFAVMNKVLEQVKYLESIKNAQVKSLPTMKQITTKLNPEVASVCSHQPKKTKPVIMPIVSRTKKKNNRKNRENKFQVTENSKNSKPNHFSISSKTKKRGSKLNPGTSITGKSKKIGADLNIHAFEYFPLSTSMSSKCFNDGFAIPVSSKKKNISSRQKFKLSSLRKKSDPEVPLVSRPQVTPIVRKNTEIDSFNTDTAEYVDNIPTESKTNKEAKKLNQNISIFGETKKRDLRLKTDAMEHDNSMRIASKSKKRTTKLYHDKSIMEEKTEKHDDSVSMLRINAAPYFPSANNAFSASSSRDGKFLPVVSSESYPKATSQLMASEFYTNHLESEKNWSQHLESDYQSDEEEYQPDDVEINYQSDEEEYQPDEEEGVIKAIQGLFNSMPHQAETPFNLMESFKNSGIECQEPKPISSIC